VPTVSVRLWWRFRVLGAHDVEVRVALDVFETNAPTATASATREIETTARFRIAA
jgi:hypothetical protein